MSFTVTESNELSAVRWDVIVIGAGVAGCIAARQCAQAGLRTLLVEGRTAPRPKVCGGCLNSRAIRLLEDIGLDQLIRDLRGESFSGICLRAGKSTAFLKLPVGVSVTRSTLDWALLNAAHESGAAVVTETSATILAEIDDETRRVDLHRHDGVVSLHARVVICADGLLRTSLHALPEMHTSHPTNSRVGVGAVIESGTSPASLAERVPHDRITMIVDRHGYVGLTWAEEGRLSVAGALDPDFVKSVGSPGGAVGQILAPFELEIPDGVAWHGTPSLTVSPQRNSAERIFVIGDAAGYVEPFTGEGMAAAVEEAVFVVPLICQAVCHWHPTLADTWQRQHGQLFRKRQRVCHLAVAVLRRPWLSRLAMNVINTFPQSGNYFVNRVARPTVVHPEG